MSNQPESTTKVIEIAVDLSQNIVYQGEHSAFECSICRKTYENIHKGQFHETICEFRHSTELEKLCWYCNNLRKTKYPTYFCSRHGEYPDTDEEFSRGENDIEPVVEEQCDNCDSPSFNVDEMYLDYLSHQAERDEDHYYEQLRWEADEEAYNATHCWYCDKQCASEEEKKCHESYCKTRDHGNYSDDEW